MGEISNKIPHVAVIIACHNYGHYIGNAIQSVVEQDYPNKSIIITDDGSTDNSNIVIRNLIQNKKDEYKDSEHIIVGNIGNTKVVLLRNDKAQKQWSARNKATKYAWDFSDYFSILDADDIYLPGKISKCVKKIQESPSIGAVYNDLLIKNLSTGTTIHEFAEPFSHTRLIQECITKNTPLISKIALEKVGLYEEYRFAEDWHLMIKIDFGGFLIVHIPEPLSQYHITGQNCSEQMNQEQRLEDWNKVRQWIVNAQRS